MFSTTIDSGAVFMTVITTAALAALIGIYVFAVRFTDDKRLLTKALETSGLTAPLFVFQDPEDWRIALGEATYPQYGRVKFQTVGVGNGSVKLLINNLGGRKITEAPLIVA